MNRLNIDRIPDLKDPWLIAAFVGWPDAGEVASSSVRYLGKALGGWKFAEIEAEEFYNFIKMRPLSRRLSPFQREVIWPTNDFYYCRAAGTDLVLFLGTEPHLRWTTYISSLMDVARRCNVSRVITLGATYDNVLHTADPWVSGATSIPEMRQKLENLGVHFVNYQGPTSIHSVILYVCQRQSIPSVSLWGHAPFYIQVSPNTKSAYGLLNTMSKFMDLRLPLEPLQTAGEALVEQINNAIAQDPRLASYIRQIEERIRELRPSPTEVLNPQDVIREAEEFLKRQQGGGSDGQQSQEP